MAIDFPMEFSSTDLIAISYISIFQGLEDKNTNNRMICRCYMHVHMQAAGKRKEEEVWALSTPL